MTETALEKAQEDVRAAMKAGDRPRVGALRMIVDALQKEAKLGKGDEVAVLQRERKKRLEAAEAYRNAGRTEQAETEALEAELITAYLPEQLGQDELDRLAAEAVKETGATEPREMGQVMSVLMPRVAGRADGKRVSAAVRQALGA